MVIFIWYNMFPIRAQKDNKAGDVIEQAYLVTDQLMCVYFFMFYSDINEGTSTTKFPVF